MRWLPLVLLLGFAQPAQAQTVGIIPAGIQASGTLTKLGENDYQFDFDWSLYNFYMPPGGIDPGTGYPVSYSPYLAGKWYGFAGIPLGVYDWSAGFGQGDYGYFRSTDTPAVLNLWVDYWIEGEFLIDGYIHDKFIAGEWQGRATLIGDVPTEIGQSTAWAATPEPATLCLLGLALLALTVRRKTLWLSE